MPKPRLIFIVGPTAVGKSETAVILAKKFKAEIISCDSMQVYKRMDIITSKPSALQRNRVRHHLIDIVEPTKRYNVANFRKEALIKIKEILKKGRTPLFVGGTGLYMSILIDGIFTGGYRNENIRKFFYREAKRKGNNYLYEKLKNYDPEAAAKIHRNDTKRLIRALEVFKGTGKPISSLQKERIGLSEDYDIKIFCLNMERHKLRERINRRVDEMFAKGLVSEVDALLKKKLSETAVSAIGIKELKGYFDGIYSMEEANQLIKRNTGAYAKRQLTWFRKDRRIKWINVKDSQAPSETAQKIWKELY